MQWLKHDTNANQDAKLKKVRMKYGLEGYGLYWYCIELIASDVNQNNLTFELEHDAEIISFDTGIHVERVNEMMAYMVNVGLFESANNTVTCLKLLKRLDQSMTSNKKMRDLISKAKENHDSVMTHHDDVMTLPDFVMQEETKRDETKKDISQSNANALANTIIDLYNKTKEEQQPNWTSVESRTKSRMALVKKRIADTQKRIGSKDEQDVIDWFSRFLPALAEHQFYSGKPKFNGDSGYKWNFDSLLREKNFVAAIEALNDE